MHIGVITNPRSRQNRRRFGRREALARRVGDHGVVTETRSVGCRVRRPRMGRRGAALGPIVRLGFRSEP